MNSSSPPGHSPRTVAQAIQHCWETLRDSDAYFGHGTDNAWDEAVQMVLAVAGLPADSDDSVASRPLDADTVQRLRSLMQRRINERIPLPYLLGKAWFAGLEFRCDERAIIPRSPLAELILEGFQPWYQGPAPRRVLDLCCGGGCIGLAVAHYFPEAVVDLLDIDEAALQLARDNTGLLELGDRVNVIQSDLFAALGRVRYDLVLSNPPYVDAGDLAVMPAEYRHEPGRALAAGMDGLDVTRRILREAGDYLHEHGVLIVEVGNSAEALETAYPGVPFTWIDFEHGGDGVFILTAGELRQYRTHFSD